MLTGIGGQGVQLAAQVLARAAAREGRQAMVFGVYAGMMRGGNSDSTLVVADGPIQSPPIVSRAWAAICLHHKFWQPLRDKLRDDAVVVVNTPVFDAEIDRARHRVVDVEASRIAHDLGFPMGASMVAAGAFAALTDLVGLPALVDAMAEALPPYRQQHAPRNIAALEAGYGAVPRGLHPAWESSTVPA